MLVESGKDKSNGILSKDPLGVLFRKKLLKMTLQTNQKHDRFFLCVKSFFLLTILSHSNVRNNIVQYPVQYLENSGPEQFV